MIFLFFGGVPKPIPKIRYWLRYTLELYGMFYSKTVIQLTNTQMQLANIALNPKNTPLWLANKDLSHKIHGFKGQILLYDNDVGKFPT